VSIAALKEELLREITAAALSGVTNHGGFPRDELIRCREWVFTHRGPALIVAHVHDGSRIWLAPSTFTQTGDVQIVLTDVVLWINDDIGVSRLCVRRDPESPPGRFETYHLPLFLAATHISAFLSNVLNGHARDA